MKTKQILLISALGAVLLLSVVLIFLNRGKLFPRHVADPQPHEVEGASPAKAVFIDVIPVTFHPLKRQEIALPDGEALSPRVSPDGSRIVCVVTSGGKGRLALAELPSGAVSTLAVELDYVADPSWNADGSQIVFSGTHQGVSEIYLYNIAAKKLTQVTRGARQASCRLIMPLLSFYSLPPAPLC